MTNVQRSAPPARPVAVSVTRLRVHDGNEHFPEDLMFVETGDREYSEGRHIIRRPWRGEATCAAAKHCAQSALLKRQTQAALTRSNLTDWTPGDRDGMQDRTSVKATPRWERLWPIKGG